MVFLRLTARSIYCLYLILVSSSNIRIDISLKQKYKISETVSQLFYQRLHSDFSSVLLLSVFFVLFCFFFWGGGGGGGGVGGGLLSFSFVFV